jgi:hypothetical protein
MFLVLLSTEDHIIDFPSSVWISQLSNLMIGLERNPVMVD